VLQQLIGEVNAFIFSGVKFLWDVVQQKFLKSVDILQSYSKIKGEGLRQLWCTAMHFSNETQGIINSCAVFIYLFIYLCTTDFNNLFIFN